MVCDLRYELDVRHELEWYLLIVKRVLKGEGRKEQETPGEDKGHETAGRFGVGIGLVRVGEG